MIGDTVNQYRILEQLGEGGMGVVYLAEDSVLKRKAALKFISGANHKKGELRERLSREAQAAARLSHPNICTVYEFGAYEDYAFISLEYVEGETLKERMKHSTCSNEEIRFWLLEVAKGLYAAHKQGVVHRDIKPSNIMITHDGHVKIMDFGIAKLSDADTELTQTNSTLGTIAYMSPEQAMGEKVDHRTDIWSLGVVMYELATGKRPFGGVYLETVIYTMMHTDLKAPRTMNPEIDQDLERVIMRCLMREKEDRYGSIGDMLDDLGGTGETLRTRPAYPQSIGLGAEEEAHGLRLTPVVFLAFASTKKEDAPYERNFPEEKQRIVDRFKKVMAADICEVVVRTDVTVKELLDVFQEYRGRVAIFHFSGYSEKQRPHVESNESTASSITTATLLHFVANQPGIRLVFLNGCATEQQAEFLITSGVGAVITTSREIKNAVAIRFAECFYKAAAAGATLESAYNEAVDAVKRASIVSEQKSDLELDALTYRGDRWPWHMYVREGAEQNKRWSLSKEANTPLWGIPEPAFSSLPESPYQYIFRYGEEDAAVFFGRAREIREIYDLVTDRAARPIILFYGNTAIGKSSLLRAGLVPRLRKDYHVIYASRDPRLGLTGTINASVGALYDTAADSSHVASSIADKWHSIEKKSGKPLIIILDQVEEAYTNAVYEKELSTFIEFLSALYSNKSERPKGTFILSFRKEWLAEIDGLLKEHRLPRSQFYLNRLGPKGVMEIVLGPTRKKLGYQLTVEHPLEEIIANDLLNSVDVSIAPMLSILMAKMWEVCKNEADAGRSFTIDAYQGLKKKGLLLDDFLDSRIAELGQWNEEVIVSGLLLDILNFHTTNIGSAAVRTLEELRTCYAHRLDILESLIDESQNRYLLVKEEKAYDLGERRTLVRLKHDILAPLVQKRHNESNYPGQQAARLLKSRTSESSEGQTGQLLDAAGLEIVEKGQQGMRAWTVVEKRLVEQSRLLRRKIKTRRYLVYGVLFFITAGIGWTYWYSNRYNVCQIAGNDGDWCRACIDHGGKWQSEIEDRTLDCQGALFDLPDIATDFEEIYPGSFEMGSAVSADESPVHPVVIGNPFHMGKTEVTQAQWYAVMGTNPSSTKGDILPVHQVSWQEVQEFIEQLNTLSTCSGCFRLPTEAEWEYACRAGSEGLYGFDEGELTEYAWYEAQNLASVQPVAQLKPNGYGLYDMSGNVYEWVQDWYAPYDSSIVLDPEGPLEGEEKVIRGGAFNGAINFMRCSDRYKYVVTDRASVRGFRLVAEPPR